MNVLPGRISADGQALEAAGLRWPVTPAQATHAGKALCWGMRPTDLRLADDGQGVPAQVEVVEPTGAETEMQVQAGTATLSLVLPGRTRARVGDRVHVAVDASKAHLFDAGTQQRLD